MQFGGVAEGRFGAAELRLVRRVGALLHTSRQQACQACQAARSARLCAFILLSLGADLP